MSLLHRIALEKSQAAYAAMLRVSPESSRTWDAERRATPPQVMVRAKAVATDGPGARRDLTSPLVFHHDGIPIRRGRPACRPASSTIVAAPPLAT